ncbi:MAG: C1 family peptidase [Bacteroidales bacterium]|nr:C1 family peptidase [Bacteroidales bacterium]
MKKILIIATALLSISAFAQKGGLDEATLSEIRKGYEGTSADKALRNAMNAAPLAVLAHNFERAAMIDTHFSDEIKTKGRTDQKSSGRCWLFTGLNILRESTIERFNLGAFKFSQNYCFFYDQLEKANLFLQAVIDTRDKSFDDRTVDWLFAHPISDGGTFTGVADIISKYGVVPAEIFPESLSATSTSAYRGQLATLLRQDGLALRDAPKKADLQKMKVEMLKEIYRVLALTLGEPPTEFEWTCRDAKGKVISTKTYTPLSFYEEFVGFDLQNNYIMLMNDPAREYGKVYEIEYDRHSYDGHNWLYVNLPLDDIKKMAIASIKGGDPMYFSCDVGKFLDRKRGICDLKNFDYESLLGVKYTMDKKQRILTHASASTHAMTLIAVDLKDGVPQKWMVENSWGDTGYKGSIIMTDEWFDEYMFRLVVEKKYVPAEIQALLKQKPTMLPAWDPMFLPEE